MEKELSPCSPRVFILNEVYRGSTDSLTFLDKKHHKLMLEELKIRSRKRDK